MAEIGGGAVGANYLRSLNIDEPFIRQTGTGNEHYHTDVLGSSLVLSNTQGASAVAYTYEPFGKTTTSGTSSNALQFTGRENDGTRVHYYRGRYFDAQLHRFIAEDPVEFQSGDTNLYGYVRNRPTAFTDPYGEAIPPLIAAGAVFGAGINATAYLVGYYFSSDPFDPRALGAAVINGAISGALSGVAGPLGGTLAKALSQSSSGTLAKALTGLGSGVASAVGQYVSNQVTGRKDSVACAAGFGAAGGFAGSFVPNRVANTLKQAAHFSPSLKNLLTFGSPQSVAISGSTVLGNVIGAGSEVCQD